MRRTLRFLRRQICILFEFFFDWIRQKRLLFLAGHHQDSVFEVIVRHKLHFLLLFLVYLVNFWVILSSLFYGLCRLKVPNVLLVKKPEILSNRIFAQHNVERNIKRLESCKILIVNSYSDHIAYFRSASSSENRGHKTVTGYLFVESFSSLS